MIFIPMFLTLLQVSFGKKKKLCEDPSDRDWIDLYKICLKQAVLGVTFMGVEKLKKNGIHIPQQLLYEWIGNFHMIESSNLQLNQRAVEVSDFFKKAGFQACLLKGQGNAQMYPQPLSRMPGDIDLWVSGGKDKVCQFVKQRYPEAKECDWHIDFPMFKDTAIEIHFTPGYARSPKYDKLLQEYFKKNAETQFANHTSLYGTEGTVSVPTFEFNVVLQLSHIMRHFMIEGIGMRHMIDFYYLLMSPDNQKTNRAKVEELLAYLGLARFASAVMWVMKEVFLLDESRMIVKPHKKRGELLLDDILRGGNFGKYNSRKIWERTLRFAWLFPVETVLTPFHRRLKKII